MYIQLLDTKSPNVNIVNEYYIYETDTIKIIYSLWEEEGIMSFAIFNKLNVPIYIDWKKSSYIDNSIKLDYWIDEESINSSSYYGGYYYNGVLLRPGYTINKGIKTTQTTKVKPERITFLPPKSNCYKSQFHILPQFYYTFNTNTEYKDVNRNDRPEKKTKVYEKNFTKDTSPLIFRNYITISLTEDFKKEIHIDNIFYISCVKEMELNHFKYVEKYVDGIYYYLTPFKNNTSFYLNVPEYKDVETRKKLSN